jgi:hypothetical protein
MLTVNPWGQLAVFHAPARSLPGTAGITTAQAPVYPRHQNSVTGCTAERWTVHPQYPQVSRLPRQIDLKQKPLEKGILLDDAWPINYHGDPAS